jgi:hypothetical protein
MSTSSFGDYTIPHDAFEVLHPNSDSLSLGTAIDNIDTNKTDSCRNFILL